mmetsp:Transcript_58636/g.136353  ORF Transcript_58636/g.136353 Transcript_58636/m.136353 type:complete len:480 (-) Transcript_58636:134-1573(-)
MLLLLVPLVRWRCRTDASRGPRLCGPTEHRPPGQRPWQHDEQRGQGIAHEECHEVPFSHDIFAEAHRNQEWRVLERQHRAVAQARNQHGSQASVDATFQLSTRTHFGHEDTHWKAHVGEKHQWQPSEVQHSMPQRRALGFMHEFPCCLSEPPSRIWSTGEHRCQGHDTRSKNQDREVQSAQSVKWQRPEHRRIHQQHCQKAYGDWLRTMKQVCGPENECTCKHSQNDPLMGRHTAKGLRLLLISFGRMLLGWQQQQHHTDVGHQIHDAERWRHAREPKAPRQVQITLFQGACCNDIWHAAGEDGATRVVRADDKRGNDSSCRAREWLNASLLYHGPRNGDHELAADHLRSYSECEKRGNQMQAEHEATPRGSVPAEHDGEALADARLRQSVAHGHAAEDEPDALTGHAAPCGIPVHSARHCDEGKECDAGVLHGGTCRSHGPAHDGKDEDSKGTAIFQGQRETDHGQGRQRHDQPEQKR